MRSDGRAGDPCAPRSGLYAPRRLAWRMWTVKRRIEGSAAACCVAGTAAITSASVSVSVVVMGGALRQGEPTPRAICESIDFSRSTSPAKRCAAQVLCAARMFVAGAQASAYGPIARALAFLCGLGESTQPVRRLPRAKWRRKRRQDRLSRPSCKANLRVLAQSGPRPQLTLGMGRFSQLRCFEARPEFSMCRVSMDD
jgi:hypothetical protein